MKKTKQLISLYKIHLGLLLWVIGNSHITYAQTVVLQNDSLAYQIDKYVQVLYDTTGKLTIEDIRSPTQQARFEKGDGINTNVKQHWYKIEIDNQTNKSFFYLDVYNTFHTALYVVENEHITHLMNGVRIPKQKRAYLGSPSQYPLHIGKGKITLYIAYQHTNICEDCIKKRSFILHEPNEVFIKHMSQNVINFSIMSILAALAVYNLFIYFLVKDRSYLYYVLSIGSIVGYFLANFINFVWFKPDFLTSFNVPTATSVAFVGISVVFFIKFSQTFLNTPLAYPRWHKRLQILAWCIAIAIFISFWVVLLDKENLFLPITLLLTNVLLSIFAVFLILLSMQAWQTRSLTGKYYAYANMMVFMCILVYIGGLTNVNLYKHNFWTLYSLRIGIVIQMLLFSVALAGRINLLKQEVADKKLENERMEKRITEQKNIELERKVKERTQALEQSNEEIRTQADKIEKQARLIEDQKNRELLNHTLQVLQKNELLPVISKFLEQHSTLLGEQARKESKELQKEIQNNLTSDQQWDTLKMHFEEVHPTLFAELQRLAPELTKNDLRYCAYMKMGLSNKDIAQLLHLDPESVRKQQYRIKQKLGLEKDISLNDFVQSLKT